MTEQRSGPPARDDVAAVDALYRPFPDFSSWPRLGPGQRDLWARFSAELNDQKGRATEDQLEWAVNLSVRAAAIDSGAIEGLYQVDRGFTMSVALQTLAWEHALGERGDGVRELFEAQLAGYELAIAAVTGKAPLSEAWLRSLHEQICAPQAKYRVHTEMGWQEQALQKGRYKESPNHVRLADGLSQESKSEVVELRMGTPARREMGERAVDAVRSRLRSAQVIQGFGDHPAPTGYRRIAGRQAPVVTIALGTPLPAAFDVSLSFSVNIALDEATPFGFQLQVLGNQDSMDIRDTDVTPEVSQSLKFRLDKWVQLHLGTLLAQLEEKTKGALREYR
jgi:hypothetical protein